MMITVSLCMIVKNEEERLAVCLDSVSDLVDEIILVDTGSTDQTKQIARRYTDRVFDFEWIDDFAKARNYSFRQATMDYILWMDADDVLLEPDRLKFQTLKQSLASDVDVVMMIYRHGFDEFGNAILSYRRERLTRRQNQFEWYGAVHEYLEVGGHVINSDIAITHRGMPSSSDRNLRIYENRLAKGELFAPRDLHYYANELMDHQMYDKAIEYYEKFLDTKAGWVEDEIRTCDKLAEIYRRLGDPEKEFYWMVRGFHYTPPRAEFCCRLGYYFLERDDAKTASFYYELATELERPKDNWGFFHEACWTWLPHIQLCVCYFKMGDYGKSYHHNENARYYRSADQRVLHNKQLLEALLQDS